MEIVLYLTPNYPSTYLILFAKPSGMSSFSFFSLSVLILSHGFEVLKFLFINCTLVKTTVEMV